jgi:sulfur carrier protein ThiS
MIDPLYSHPKLPEPRERMITPQQTGTDRISVRVTLFADLRRFLPKGADGPQTFALPAGATVADLLAAIGIPAEDEVTVGLNGEQAARETVLRDGDDAVMFSPMEGG